MDSISSNGLKRNPKAIKDKLKTIGNTVKTSVDMKILVYDTFVSKRISILDNVCRIIGIVAIVDSNNNYAIMTVPGVINVEPNEISSIEIDGELYYELHITAGELLISDTNVVKDTDYVYKIFEALMLRGKVPFFIMYQDLLKIFINMPKYNGGSVGKDPLPFEIFTAIMARSSNDPTVFYRNSKHGDEEPKWIGFMNIYYSFSSTLSKVVGSYFKTGVLVANVNKQKEPTKLEKILRA